MGCALWPCYVTFRPILPLVCALTDAALSCLGAQHIHPGGIVSSSLWIVLPFSPILPVLPRLESQHVFWYDRPQKADPASIPFAGRVSYSAQGSGGGA